MYICGVDLGQAQDFTAIAIIEKIEEPGQEQGRGSHTATYNVVRLERTLGTSYPNVVSRIREIMTNLPDAALVVDSTGVGQPVVDMIRQAGLKPIAIFIHGGDRVTHEGDTYRTPKRDLVAILQVLLQNQQLKIAPGPLSDTLASEMLNFKVKIDPATAHDSYSAWREAAHDDLVLAVALGCWWGEHNRGASVIIVPKPRIFTYESRYHDFGLGGTRANSPAAIAYQEAHQRRSNKRR